jgi:hypothetical protein
VKRDESNLDRLWFQLVNTDLYCITLFKKDYIGFKNKDDKEYTLLINVIGQVVEEETENKIDERYTIYPFTLCSRWDKRTIYAVKKEERKMWVDKIRNVLKYSDIYITYELGVTNNLLKSRSTLEKEDRVKLGNVVIKNQVIL